MVRGIVASVIPGDEKFRAVWLDGDCRLPLVGCKAARLDVHLNWVGPVNAIGELPKIDVGAACSGCRLVIICIVEVAVRRVDCKLGDTSGKEILRGRRDRPRKKV